MTLIVSNVPNDLAILWLGQQSDTDARVPTAEELAAGEVLLRDHTTRTRAALKPAGLLSRPTFTAGGRTVVMPPLSVWSPLHPRINTTVQRNVVLPAFDPGLVINRYDYLYLLAFSAEVGAAIDSGINLQFQWRDEADALQTITKENTRRIRDYWAFVWSPEPLSESQLLSEIPTVNGRKTITVSSSTSGAVLGTRRLYTLDPNLLDGASYPLSGAFELIDLLRVWRVQRVVQDGYWWGQAGEDGFVNNIHLQPTYRYVGEGWNNWASRARETLWRIMRGEPVADSPGLNRFVQNLVNGQVGANTSAPGVATISPNGSTALANEQRISFTNRALTQTTYAVAVTTTNSGGQAVATINFAGNSPSGATFATSGHKIFNAAGLDISSEGSFTGGGGTGALTWTESSSANIAPGDTAYLVPAISYPSGSGFPVCGSIERVFLNSVPLSSANVRETDLSTYQLPANNEDHIVVMARGNAGLRWIYKKFEVTSTAGGVIRIPTTARGLIAWVSGPSAPAGRQDLPVVTGLSANTPYTVLCYHAPPGSEQWQFQLLAPTYAGSGEREWLNGAKVNTHPITLAHCQGGGNTSMLGDASIRDDAIALRLPQNLSALAVRAFTMSTPIQIAGETDLGNVPFQEVQTRAAGSDVAALRPGQVLSAAAAVEVQPRSMAVSLTANGVPVGVLKPRLESNGAYQIVVAADVGKDGQHRLLVAAYNGGSPSQVNFLQANTDNPHFAAIDTYKYF